MNKTVEVYLLWGNGTWERRKVEVEAEPWTDNVIETRACERAWVDIAKAGGPKPIQIGLIMTSFYQVDMEDRIWRSYVDLVHESLTFQQNSYRLARKFVFDAIVNELPVTTSVFCPCCSGILELNPPYCTEVGDPARYFCDLCKKFFQAKW